MCFASIPAVRPRSIELVKPILSGHSRGYFRCTTRPKARVGFVVSNLPRSPEGIITFYNQRGTCEKHIKEGKNAIKWTRLSCRTFAANAVRLQLHALAYNLANFMWTLAQCRR